MFRFEFEEELFRFQMNSPAFEPLFQFPPMRASAHPIALLYFKIQNPNPLKTLGDCVPQTP